MPSKHRPNRTGTSCMDKTIRLPRTRCNGRTHAYNQRRTQQCPTRSEQARKTNPNKSNRRCIISARTTSTRRKQRRTTTNETPHIHPKIQPQTQATPQERLKTPPKTPNITTPTNTIQICISDRPRARWRRATNSRSNVQTK